MIIIYTILKTMGINFIRTILPSIRPSLREAQGGYKSMAGERRRGLHNNYIIDKKL